MLTERYSPALSYECDTTSRFDSAGASFYTRGHVSTANVQETAVSIIPYVEENDTGLRHGPCKQT